MLQLACSTLCFTQHPRDEALRRIAQLGFRYVDLGAQQWAHVSARELVHSGEGIVASLQRSLQQAGVELSAMNVGLDRSADVSLVAQPEAVCALAAAHSLPAICVNAPARDTPLNTAITEFRQLAAIAACFNVTLCLETHVNCLTELPAVAVRLVESVPNLGLALDPSHFYAGPWQGRDFSITYPHTHIVHLRDAGNSPEKIQMPPGKGCVDFAGILRGLTQHGFSGTLVVEYIDTRIPMDAYDDYVLQVREMANLAETLLTERREPPS